MAKPPAAPPAAHTPPTDGEGEWHDLKTHLESVAARASEFANSFDARDHGYLLGLLHDIGKFDPEFQRYLREAHEGRRHRGPPHAIWGALLAYELLRGGKGLVVGWAVSALVRCYRRLLGFVLLPF